MTARFTLWVTASGEPKIISTTENPDPDELKAIQKQVEEAMNGRGLLYVGPDFEVRPLSERPAPGEAYLPRHEGQHADCAVCESVKA